MTEQTLVEVKVLENGKVVNYKELLELLKRSSYFDLWGIIGNMMIFELFDLKKEKIGEIHINLWSERYKGTLYDILSNPWFICFSVARERPLPITNEFVWWLKDLVTWRYVDNLTVYIKKDD
jgi:hypothetical protein